MLILRTPKGWTGPREVDGKPVEGTWRAHQVPIAGVRDNGEHLPSWRNGCEVTGRTELFDEEGRLCPSSPRSPQGDARMSANPHANGG